MSSFIRMLILVILSVVISAAMVMLITYRMAGEMNPREVTYRWSALILQKAPVAEFVKEHWGVSPPPWVQRLAVIWHRANMARWWWLPFLFLGVRWLVVRSTQRRMRR
jgi:hypothetical protein